MYRVRSGGAFLPEGTDWLAEGTDWLAGTTELRKAFVDHPELNPAVAG